MMNVLVSTLTALEGDRLRCSRVGLSEEKPLKLVDLIFTAPETVTENMATIELEK